MRKAAPFRSTATTASNAPSSASATSKRAVCSTCSIRTTTRPASPWASTTTASATAKAATAPAPTAGPCGRSKTNHENAKVRKHEIVSESLFVLSYFRVFVILPSASITHGIIHARRGHAVEAVELADRGQEVSGRGAVRHDDQRHDVAVGAVHGFVLDHG